MNWTKFGDEYPVEARELTDAEWRTHGEALMWSNFRLLDLHIPKKDVRRFAESDSDASIEEITAGLTAKKWWRDDGGEWFIGLRFPEWQRDSDEVRADRSKAAARMRRIRKHKAGDHSLCDAPSCADSPVRPNVRANGTANVRSMFAHPDPTRPDP